MGVNYKLKPGYGWAMGRFDSCERWNGDNGTNGVFLLDNNDSTYVDKTSAAWNTAAADVPITKRVLLGYCEPFDEATFTLATPADPVFPCWEYWNGSAWARLTLLADATNGLKQNGKVRFMPPPIGQRKRKTDRAEMVGSCDRSGVGSTPVASRISPTIGPCQGSQPRGEDGIRPLRGRGMWALAPSSTTRTHLPARPRGSGIRHGLEAHGQ